jgi:hypothetical protein
MLLVRLQYAVEILQNVVVPEAEDAIALCVHDAGAGDIMGALLVVLSAVDFDDELGAMAAEISRIIWGKRRLAAPVQTWKGFSKASPEHALRIGHFAAQLAGARDRVGAKREPL